MPAAFRYGMDGADWGTSATVGVGEVAEIDLNPVFVHQHGLTVVDVRIAVRSISPR